MLAVCVSSLCPGPVGGRVSQTSSLVLGLAAKEQKPNIQAFVVLALTGVIKPLFSVEAGTH